jgi:hypothetical protein
MNVWLFYLMSLSAGTCEMIDQRLMFLRFSRIASAGGRGLVSRVAPLWCPKND